MKPKKCRHCREPFTPARPMQKACSPACAIALTKKQAEAAALKKKREDLQKDRAKRHQLKTIPQLIAEAQIAFNRFCAAKAKALENPRPSPASGAQLGACAI